MTTHIPYKFQVIENSPHYSFIDAETGEIIFQSKSYLELTQQTFGFLKALQLYDFPYEFTPLD